VTSRRIYVDIGDVLLMLPDAERQVREIAFSAMWDAGITAPEIEARASPRQVTDEDEETIRTVMVMMRFPDYSQESGAMVDIDGVVNRVVAALTSAPARFTVWLPTS